MVATPYSGVVLQFLNKLVFLLTGAHSLQITSSTGLNNIGKEETAKKAMIKRHLEEECPGDKQEKVFE